MEDIIQLIESLGGGIVKLVEYIHSGLAYVTDVLIYLPVELGSYAMSIVFISVAFLYLGRSSNHG